MNNIYNKLFKENLIDNKQFSLLDAIHNNKLISLYYELRVILYLGIMLFTTGVGYFAYQNIGEIGHVVSIILIGLATVVGFYFISKHAQPYNNDIVNVNLPYFDYLLLLVSLLLISLLVYIQIYFNLTEILIHWSSYFSASILFFMAYRYDNKALLAMGITAFAAAVGLSISPVNWVKGNWSTSNELYNISILLGALLIIIGYVSNLKDIKKHFKFTYQNFGMLLLYIGGLSSIFDSQFEILYALLMIAAAGYLSYYTWKTKEFLFFLYSNLTCYIAFTYLLFSMADTMSSGIEMLLIYYFPITCITYLVLLITKKSHFKND